MAGSDQKVFSRPGDRAGPRSLMGRCRQWLRDHPSPAGVAGGSGGTGRRVWAALVALIVLSGMYFRLAEFVHDRSLWMDEAMLAENALRQPVADLAAGRLIDQQVAPAGFLLATRGLTMVAGADERILRLLPQVAGLVFLGLFGVMAWRGLGPVGALAAVALAAWSWPLVYYANEFKQYSTDVLVTLAIFGGAGWLRQRPFSARLAAATGAAGLAALEFSQPAIFALAALGTAGWVEAAGRREWKAWGRWTVVGVAWVAFFAGQLWLGYASALGNPALVEYHQPMFLKLWPPGAAWQAFDDGVLGSWKLATGEPFWGLWLALVLVGFWAGWKVCRREVIFIGLTLAFTALASLGRAYPMELRLLLFVVPLLFWLAGRGVGWLGGRVAGRAGPVVAGLLILPLAPILRDAVAEARHPVAREQLRPVIEQLAPLARPGDVIVVWAYTRFAFDYYWPRTAHDEVPVQIAPFEPDTPATAAEIAAKLAPLIAGHRHVWLVATHYELGVEPDNARALVTAIRQEYPVVASFAPRDGTALGLEFFATGPPAQNLPPDRPRAEPYAISRTRLDFRFRGARASHLLLAVAVFQRESVLFRT